jgi:FtsH-binding integral membrane protein
MGRTLLIIGLTLFVLWLLGFISSNNLGGGIHILLAVALILIIVSLVSGRKITIK